MFKQRGNTLFAIMTVLFVAAWATTSFLGIQSIENQKVSARKVNMDVEVLFLAMELHYLHHCGETTFPVMSVSSFKREGHLNGASSFANSLGNTFQMTVTGIRTENVVLGITSEFRLEEDAERVSDLARGSERVGKFVSWKKNISFNKTIKSLNRQLDRKLFGSPAC